MLQVNTSGFRKSASCPTSDRLLAFRQDKLGSFARDVIREHLCVCDFCSAEYEFYRDLPAIETDAVQPDLIPLPLYELARDILTNRTSGEKALRSILGHQLEED